MISEILKPKNEEEVLKSFEGLKIPCYRFSSFLKLYNRNVYHEGAKSKDLIDWCINVFHIDPKDMEITFIGDGIFGRILRKGFIDPYNKSFSSNDTLKLMWFGNYFVYPRGKFGEILSYLYKKYYYRKKRNLNENENKIIIYAAQRR